MTSIEMLGITKRFGTVIANDSVDFQAHSGEVHALLGENGAGKTTLMSILAGLYRPDEGTILLNGRPMQFHSPRDSLAHGIGMVYQHFMLVDSFTVTENVMLGQRGRGLALDTARVEAELIELSRSYGLQVHPRARIWQLSVGEQQRVEILRLLHRGAKVLVFDEPTAVLTPQESGQLIRTLRQMAAVGYCIIFISHKLDEVLAVADRITVLRRGRVAATLSAHSADRHTLARLMVGRDVLFRPDRPGHTSGRPTEVVLEVQSLQARGDRGLMALRGVDLHVQAGEILGIAGVAGNGQRELAEVLTGLRRAAGGRVLICGEDLTNRPARRIMELGVAHVPEDRLGTGLVPGLDLTDNAILKGYRRPPICAGPMLDNRTAGAFADRLIHVYNIAAPGRWARVRLLSGGNQQKLLLGRELSGRPRLLVAVHPTRGLDIGATEAIHRLLLDQRASGTAILLISEDLDELLALSDRVAVMYEGRIMGTVDAGEADIEQLGLMMAGVSGVSVEPTPSRHGGGSPLQPTAHENR
jgi:simple sugar transport system ATP-binding protein